MTKTLLRRRTACGKIIKHQQKIERRHSFFCCFFHSSQQEVFIKHKLNLSPSTPYVPNNQERKNWMAPKAAFVVAGVDCLHWKAFEAGLSSRGMSRRIRCEKRQSDAPGKGSVCSRGATIKDEARQPEKVIRYVQTENECCRPDLLETSVKPNGRRHPALNPAASGARWKLVFLCGRELIYGGRGGGGGGSSAFIYRL